jgi:hypothetical protein
MPIHGKLCLLSLIALVSTIGFARESQKDNEPEKLISSARFLEEKPLDKEAKNVRRWAITWVIQTDKVSVKTCSLIMSGLGKKYKYESELFGQYTIGMAAFKLSNPDKTAAEDAAQLAGVESSVTTYQAILKTEPKAQNVFMDGLVAKRSDGSLAEYVKANNCKDKQ